MFWRDIPIVRILIPFVAGIVVGINFGSTWPWLVLLLSSTGLVAVILYSVKRIRRSRQWGRVFNVMLFFFFACLGLITLRQNTSILRPNHFGHQLDSATHATVVVKEPPVEKARSYKIEVRVEGLAARNTKPVEGRALLYLPKVQDVASIEYGDVLLIENRFDTIDPPMNPGQFNYKRYLSFHNIYHQAYLPEGSWEQVDEGRGSKFWSFLFGLRTKLLDFIETRFESPREKGVASALLLGYRDKLDDETIRAYSSTGAMHVLAVSGLHVGIIFLVLNYLLRFLNRHGGVKRLLKPALLLLGIWLYACITGLSPSVQRAAVMFSFIVLGNALGRHNNIYTSICASALFLLAYDPYLITEIGFLLSYSAVIGIVFIQPRLYRRLYFKNRLLDWAWAISCVSIAAQIATFPIGLLYFHQFPTFFLISNLLVIPAATVILYAGMLMFLVIPLAPVAKAIAFLLEKFIWLLNEGIAAIDALPMSLITGVHFTRLETVLLYGLVIFGLAFLVLRKRFHLQLALGSGVAIAASLFVGNWQSASQQLITVYHVPGHSAINLITANRSRIFGDSALLADADKMLFHIEHHLWELGVNKEQRIPNGLNTDLNSIGNKNVLRLTKPLPDKPGSDQIQVDIIVVSGSPWLEVERLQDFFDFERVVFDSSSPRWLTAKWQRKCEAIGIASHDVNSEGAYIQKL